MNIPKNRKRYLYEKSARASVYYAAAMDQQEWLKRLKVERRFYLLFLLRSICEGREV